MFYIFVLLSKFCQNYRGKIENSDKILRWKFVVRIWIDLFLHTCSDFDVSFQALLHHIDFTDIDDLWSVICFPNVKTSIHFQFILFVKENEAI